MISPRVLMVATIFFSQVVIGQSLQNELLNCAQKSDNLKRLACYDSLAKKETITYENKPSVIATKTHSIPANKTPELGLIEPEIPTKTQKVESSQVTAVEKFGQEHKQSPEDLLNKIQGKIVNLKKTPYGEQIVTLDNGQVWRQTDSTRWRLSEGQVVYVERGAIGTFFMGKESITRRIRVKRVK